MTNFPRKISTPSVGAAVRVATLALFLAVFGAGAARAQTQTYVKNSYGNSVTVVDTSTNTVTATIPVGPVGSGPVHVAFAVRTQGPTGIDQCKAGGWQTFTNPKFKNQGECVSFVNHMNHEND
jgi:YVTN family beta-propeller protein